MLYWNKEIIFQGKDKRREIFEIHFTVLQHIYFIAKQKIFSMGAEEIHKQKQFEFSKDLFVIRRKQEASYVLNVSPA